MKRFIYFLLIIVLAFVTKPLWNEPVRELIPESVVDQFHSVREFTTEIIADTFNFDQLKEHYSSQQPTLPNYPLHERATEIDLVKPDERAFSIGNIELGHSKNEVTDLYGDAVRVSENDYGLSWHAYHENYQNFMMIAYDDDIVRGLFTNQDLITSQFDIELGDSKELVNETLGDPKEIIYYEDFGFQIESEGEYDVYLIDDSYVTIFYDLHQEDEVTAIQVISEEVEMQKDELYVSSGDDLREGFEYQLFDLTNATRVNHGLGILEWEEVARTPARAHSADMAENEFFSHTNLDNQTFSDRLIEAGITFTLAGENLAFGQFNSIFAHQGLMNSIGHRENILQPGFTKLGVGVDFSDDNQPFYTEKFFTE